MANMTVTPAVKAAMAISSTITAAPVAVIGTTAAGEWERAARIGASTSPCWGGMEPDSSKVA